MVVTCACKSRLYTIVNGWLGREKHVLETESNKLTSSNTSPATESVVMSLFQQVHRNMQLS